jgi:hypothetical protein
MLEQISAFDLSPFGQWKLAHFGDVNVRDDADTDSDGLSTILEYATGRDPFARSALPVLGSASKYLALTFFRNASATDLTMIVQGSDDLSAWTDLARSTSGAGMVPLITGVAVAESAAGPLRLVEVRDLYPIGDPVHPRRFLRLIASPEILSPLRRSLTPRRERVAR